MSKKVLIADDSLYMRTMIRNTLEANGYTVVGEAVNGDETIEMALDLEPDIITLDNIFPGMMGIEVAKILKEEELDIKIIMISAVGQEDMINKGKELGVVDYIVKPFSDDVLLASLKKC
ncbi:MAG: response regulator [Cyclobacteriaceae bacterium]|nr:response regulator [Cyclobacteriaceae bacterium]